MLIAVKAVSKGPIFSIQRPLSYQIADSLILPQPSTLVNALSFCLSKVKNVIIQGYGDEYLKNIMKFIRKGLVRVAVKPLTPIISTPIILSRLRTLEWSVNEIERKISEGERLSNAMIREYVFGIYSIYFLFTNREIAEKSLKFLHLLNRIGDTESITSITSVEEAEISEEGRSGLIDTYTPCNWIADISGNFVISRLCDEEYAEYRFERIGGKVSDIVKARLEQFAMYSKEFYLPFAVERVNNGYLIYKPSTFSVKTKEGFMVIYLKTAYDKAGIVIKEEWL